MSDTGLTSYDRPSVAIDLVMMTVRDGGSVIGATERCRC
jgi:hypothetical protein